MNDQSLLMESLFERTRHYAKISAELLKLKAISKSADVISTLAARLTIFLLAALFFLILNIAIALMLGEFLGRTSYGFFIIAAFYALTGTLIYQFQNKWIKTPVQELIISQSLK